MPVGSVPVTDQVIVPMPLVCVNVCEYAVPAVPAGIVVGLTVIVWQLITSGKLPVCVGVPESTPVPVFSVSPVGSVPVTDQVIVPMPLVCVNVCEYAVPA